MFYINSKTDKPDIEYLERTVSESMEKGIEIKDIGDLIVKLNEIAEYYSNVLATEYGIMNPNSPKQVANYLSSIASIEIVEACRVDGKWKTDKDAMQRLANMGYPMGNEMLKYRKAKKYLDSLRAFRDSVNPADGRVHPTVSLAKTNRINYSNPALMNIPKQLIWNLIRPRVDGNILMSVDIKNQEPTILINWLGIKELKPALVYNPDKPDMGLYERLFATAFRPSARVNIFVRKDITTPRLISNLDSERKQTLQIPDSYFGVLRASVPSIYYSGNSERIVLIEQFNVEVPVGYTGELPLPEKAKVKLESGSLVSVQLNHPDLSKLDLSKEKVIDTLGYLGETYVLCQGAERKEFKTVWNAMSYGAGYRTIKNYCKLIDGDRLYKYFNSLEELKKYKDLCSKAARNKLYSVSTLFGSKLNAGDGDKWQMERVLRDLPIQGTGSDILALLVKHLNTEIESKGLQGKLELYYSRHDELILEVDKEFYQDLGEKFVIEFLRGLFEHKIDDWEPFRVEIKRVEPVPVEDIISYFNDGDE